MKRLLVVGCMIVAALAACSSLPGGGIRCEEDFISDVSCLGNIGNLEGSQTLTARSDRLEQGSFDANVQLSIESGTVLVTFTDADGETVSQEITEAGTVRGTAGISEGAFEVVLESQGGAASGIAYTISLDEIEN